MDASLTELVGLLRGFGPAVVTTGMFIAYLMKEKAKPSMEEIQEAIRRIAVAAERQADSQERCENLLKECVDGHHETQVVLARVETKLGLRNGRAAGH